MPKNYDAEALSYNMLLTCCDTVPLTDSRFTAGLRQKRAEAEALTRNRFKHTASHYEAEALADGVLLTCSDNTPLTGSRNHGLG